ncbi:hypothetical protein AVEN_162983-1 [Araneus ventricosus]|uniref:Uncharacterized protein n=1 Tax=Araneus ventricosus TaxID=182803 RepID=A0A4Y2C0C9_ARAVE|nr:hypothetical protein AVEN_162983-1 [Araneus ventricosus]
MRGKGRSSPLRNFLSSFVTFSFYQTECRKYSTLGENLLIKKLPRIKIAKLIPFLADNEDLIKQQPDTTSLSDSDSDPDFSSSPRPQTDGPRPSRCSIPRALISPPTSF